MKNLFLALALFLMTAAAAQPISDQPTGKIIMLDNCEADPVAVWPTAKTRGWNYFSGGDHNPANTSQSASVKRVTSGQEGAPAPFKGNSSYRMRVIKDNSYPACCNYVRSEMYWGGGNGNEFTGVKWQVIAMYIPTDWCDDNRPIGVAFDNKFANAQGPASFYLKIENGQYQVNAQWPQGGTEYRTNVGAIEKGVWVVFALERNYTDQSNGFMRLYKRTKGTGTTLTQIYERLGPNYVMESGSTTEGYVLQGIYKWSWSSANGQGEGAGICNTKYDLYLDHMGFFKNTATKADIEAEYLSGTGGTNQNPFAFAGNNAEITLPTSSYTFSGSTATDPDGTIASYSWTKVSGPSFSWSGGISNTLHPTATGLSAGTYIFQMTATDNLGATASDDVTLIVTPSTPPAASTPWFTNAATTCVDTTSIYASCPVVALPDVQVQLPLDTARVSLWMVHNYVTTPSAFIQSISIAQLSGAATYEAIWSQANWKPTTAIAKISGMVAGTTSYEVTITDNLGGVKKDTFNLIAASAANVPPTVGAGTDQTLTLDGYGSVQSKSTTVTGTDADSDGTIAARRWDCVDCPENSVFGSQTSATTTISGMIPGQYRLRYTVTDDDGAQSYDEMVVRVLSCDAGADTVIVSPTTSVTLRGYASGGTVTSVLWTKISGTGGTIVDDDNLTTGVTGLTPGNYVFELRVTYETNYSVVDRVGVKAIAPASKNYYKANVVIKP
jgi:hypothetical protein